MPNYRFEDYDNPLYHRTIDADLYRYQQKWPSQQWYTLLQYTVYQVKDALVPISARIKPDQDFSRVATPFENTNSQLVFRSAAFSPIVDADFLVVGHLGWANASRILFKKATSGAIQLPHDMNAMNNLVATEEEAIVYHRSSTSDMQSEGWYDAGTTEEGYMVMTDIQGHVLQVLSARAEGALVSVAYSPVDLVLVPYLAGKAVAMTGRAAVMAVEAAASNEARAAIWSLARRDAGKALSDRAGSTFSREITAVVPGAVRTTAVEFAAADTQIIQGIRGEVSAEVMQAHLAGRLTVRRELQELMQAARLTGDAQKAKVMDALRTWQATTGKTVEYWTEGTVAKVSGSATNLLTIQGNKLIVDRVVLNNADTFFTEVTHELVADALGWSGKIDIHFLGYVSVGTNRYSSQWLLEQAVQHGGLDDVIAFLKPVR